MALPVNWSQIPVHGKYLTLLGAPASGKVTFSSSFSLRDAESNEIIIPVRIEATLDSNGEFTVNLPATDDPDIDPSGWSYHVVESFIGWSEQYDIVVPFDHVGTLEMSDVPRVQPLYPVSEFATPAQLNEETSQRVAADASLSTQIGALLTQYRVTGVALSGNTLTLSTTTGPIAVTATALGALLSSQRGAANGVAPLNASSKVDTTYLPVSVANGIPILGSDVKVPMSQIKTTGAGAVATIDADGYTVQNPKPSTIQGNALQVATDGKLFVSQANTAASGYTVDDLPLTNVIIAHRGGSNLALENSMRAFHNAAGVAHMVEADIWGTADGLICLHDNVPDNTTAITAGIDVSLYSTNALTATGLQARLTSGAPNTVSTANANYGVGADDRMPTAAQYLMACKGRTIACPEIHNHLAAQRFRDLVVTMGMQRQVIVQFRAANYDTATMMADAALFRAEGIQMMWVGGGDSHFVEGGASGQGKGIAELVAAGFTWAGVSRGETGPVTNSMISQLVAGGLRVAAWTVNNRYLKTILDAAGVTGYFTDEPTYLQDPANYRTTNSQGALGANRWGVGMLWTQSPGNTAVASKRDDGGALTGTYWNAGAGVYGNMNWGLISPVANPIYTVTFNFKFVTLPTDTTRWASIWLGVDDRPYLDDTNTAYAGYHILLRASGQYQIYRRAVGATSGGTAVATGTGAAFATNTPLSFTISKNQTTGVLSLVRNTATTVTTTYTDPTPLDARYIQTFGALTNGNANQYAFNNFVVA